MASCDDIIEIEHEEGASVRNINVRKAKDGVEGPAGAFTLQSVELGIGADGEPITSCVVKPSSNVSARKRRRPKVGTVSETALTELEHLAIDGKGKPSKGHARIPDGVELINVDVWRAACRKKRLSEGDEQSERRAFRRTKTDLSALGWIGSFDGSVWLIPDKSLGGQNAR